ncbi:MAG: DNA polymerase III subunit epsilon, partial [Betaproteobacteria bacterium]|nr:DNA polymerase III subunit epsilon [Betaproteobacteria bacterium]
MLPCYVLLDLETTGSNPVLDRITEVAVMRVEQGEVVAKWSRLLNPGQRIPPFIQQLTGIDDAMVAGAPAFGEVLPELLAVLDGAVLVAHNVRFDHGFLKQAAAREGVDLRVKTLCTVRLSRKLYPQARGHGLDAIMRRHGLHTTARHRAMGDVELLHQWLHIAQTELGPAAVQTAAQELLRGSASLPPHLETPVDDIPEAPGVYLFYGEGEVPLYIGKSVRLRSRVLSHFQADHRDARELRLAQEVRRVEWRETAGEFGALLLEMRLIKELQPLLNRQLRRERQLCAWRLAEDPVARPLLTLVRGDELDPRFFPQLYGCYRSKRQAVDALRALAQR